MTKHNNPNRAYKNLVKKYKHQGLSDVKAINKANHAMRRTHGLVTQSNPVLTPEQAESLRKHLETVQASTEQLKAMQTQPESEPVNEP